MLTTTLWSGRRYLMVRSALGPRMTSMSGRCSSRTRPSGRKAARVSPRWITARDPLGLRVTLRPPGVRTVILPLSFLLTSPAGMGRLLTPCRPARAAFALSRAEWASGADRTLSGARRSGAFSNFAGCCACCAGGGGCRPGCSTRRRGPCACCPDRSTCFVCGGCFPGRSTCCLGCGRCSVNRCPCCTCCSCCFGCCSGFPVTRCGCPGSRFGSSARRSCCRQFLLRLDGWALSLGRRGLTLLRASSPALPALAPGSGWVDQDRAQQDAEHQ